MMDWSFYNNTDDNDYDHGDKCQSNTAGHTCSDYYVKCTVHLHELVTCCLPLSQANWTMKFLQTVFALTASVSFTEGLSTPQQELATDYHNLNKRTVSPSNFIIRWFICDCCFIILYRVLFGITPCHGVYFWPIQCWVWWSSCSGNTSKWTLA